MKNQEKKMVLVLLDKEGRVYHAGKPELFSGKEIAEALKSGDTVNTVTLEEYKKLRWSKIYGFEND